MIHNQPELSRITELVVRLCRDHNDIAEPERQIDLTGPETARLYGREGVLDSLGLVSLLASIEQAFEDEYGVHITIADERAFSQARSPFRTVASLSEYVHRISGENRD